MNDVIISFQSLSAQEMAIAGGKGSGLARLFQSNIPVPDGFVILPAAFVADQLTPDGWTQVEEHLGLLRKSGSDLAFAIRSSALSEDSASASFAGEFETVLNMKTDPEIRQAIETVYRSRQSERVLAYSQVKGISPSDHQISVVVQILVPAECSGVLFTAHPVTGRRDQVMISASWGLGEAIVSGIVTPDTLVLDKNSRRIIQRETADKQVMTVLIGSGTEEQPVPGDMQRKPVLTDNQAFELMKIALQVESLFGCPMDIEWAIAGGRIFILQARPITTLPAAEPSPPTEWKLPKGFNMAVRNNIVELMADPLTPLFGTMGLAAVNTSMRRLLSDFFGKPELAPDEMIIQVNHYAYYGSAWSAGQILYICLHSVGIMKKMFTGAVERWTGTGRARYVETIIHWKNTPWRERPAAELLQAVRELAKSAIDAYGAMVSGLIPAAWISEGLFTLVYNSMIKRRHDPKAPVFLMGFDSAPIQAEKALFDLAAWINDRHELAVFIQNTPSGQISAAIQDGRIPPDAPAGDWKELLDRISSHLNRFGHAIYNLDFSNPTPVDDPTPLLETMKWFVSGRGIDPYQRQSDITGKRLDASKAVENRVRGIRLKLFRRLLDTAQRYAPLREDGLFDLGLAYPLLRQMLLEIGSRLVNGGGISTPADIFWLQESELKQAADRLDKNQPLEGLSGKVQKRKAAWRAARQVTPPRMLPNKILGLDLNSMRSRRLKGRSNTIHGVAASPGVVTAPARVIHGPEDFGQMQPGEVLVAALTTPAWTPLFARAAAIVTDIGGPLSHGSIVAREYNIPAVLGTGSATARIQTGQTVTVDGSAGTVKIK